MADINLRSFILKSRGTALVATLFMATASACGSSNEFSSDNDEGSETASGGSVTDEEGSGGSSDSTDGSGGEDSGSGGETSSTGGASDASGGNDGAGGTTNGTGSCETLCSRTGASNSVQGECVDNEIRDLGYLTEDVPSCQILAGAFALGQATTEMCRACYEDISATDEDCATAEAACY